MSSMVMKKPSAAQLKTRANFIKMVKERARLRALGQLPATKHKVAKIAKVKRKVGKPSPAQLAARAKFVAMVRAKAKGKKKANPKWTVWPVGKSGTPRKGTRGLGTVRAFTKWGAGRKAKRLARRSKTPRGTMGLGLMRMNAKGKKNPGVIKMSEAQFAKLGKRIGLSSPAPVRTRSTGIGRPHRKAARKFKKVDVFGGSGFLGLGRSIQRIKRENPGLFAKLKGLIAGGGKKKVAKVGYRKTQRGKYRPTKYMERKSLSHGRPVLRYANPTPAKVFTEFRGKGVTRKTKVKAASGTPSTLAELGKLRELKLRGRTLRFKAGRLAADGRKKLHIVGVKMKYRGNPGGEIDVGEIISVTYEADKPHVESGIYNYIHKFGEEGGKRPHLIVDPEGYPVIEGGSYRINADGIID
jgi:hypothetical protein